MTTLEIRAELHKAIDKAPENALTEILEYINSIQQPLTDRDKLTKFIDKVFQEDDGLLRRLAQ